MRIARVGAMTRPAFARLREAGMADFDMQGETTTNTRNVRCRVCRKPLTPGSAIAYHEFMTDGYRFSRRYVCADCKAATIARVPPTTSEDTRRVDWCEANLRRGAKASVHYPALVSAGSGEWTGDTLRAAIDAAMSATRTPSGGSE